LQALEEFPNDLQEGILWFGRCITSERRNAAMKRRAPKLALLLGSVMLLCWGCVTPVIPLPPPDPANLALTPNSCDASAGTIKFKGNDKVASAHSYVFIWNTATSVKKGIVRYSNDKGGFAEVTDFPASDGHELWIWTKAALHEENKSDTVAVTVDCSMQKGMKNGFVKKL